MIRKIKPDDKKELVNILERVTQFSDLEKDTAIELIDESIFNADSGYYNTFVYEENGSILGYHCTGPRALTDGVFDMYWIVVDPTIRAKGIGAKLLAHSEEFVLQSKGRLLLAETSSLPIYENARKFYIKNNFVVLAEIKDFYKIGDDLVIFGKYLTT